MCVGCESRRESYLVGMFHVYNLIMSPVLAKDKYHTHPFLFSCLPTLNDERTNDEQPKSQEPFVR